MSKISIQEGICIITEDEIFFIAKDLSKYPDLIQGKSLKDGEAKKTAKKVIKDLGYEKELEKLKGKNTHTVIRKLKKLAKNDTK